MSFSWLNPANWVRSMVASAVDAKVDEYVTPTQAKLLVNEGVNKAVGMTDGSVSDDRLRTVAKGLVNAGEALKALGNGIDPDGPDGRKLSQGEQDAILKSLEFATGALMTDEQCASWRTSIKSFVHAKIGVN